MNDIRDLLRIAARRLETSSFLNRLHFVACAVAGVALLLVVADRAGAQSFVPWFWVGPAFALVAVLVAGGMWWMNRRSESSVAIEVDERLELRERLSTALAVAQRDDPFARAAVEDAVRAARDARNREQVRRRFQIAPPGGWYISPLLVLAALMFAQLSPLNLFARKQAQSPEIVAAQQQVVESIDAIVREIQEQPELSDELADVLGDLANEEFDPLKPRKPEDLRREAIKKVTELNRKLNEIIDGERGKTADSLDRKLKDLKPPTDGPAKDFADALSKGNFADAQEALEKLMEQAKAGELTEEQMKQLAEQLADIAKQLQNLAEQQQDLERALQNAGLDPALAQNPQALQQAIQNSEHLNEQQKQQLQQMAQAQQAANQMCQGLGQACQAMAQGLAQGDMGMAEGGMGQAGSQLSDMEQLQQLLQQAMAAANACEGQCQGLGQGMGMQMINQQWSQGQGMGGWGEGQGGKAPIAPTPNRFRMTKADVHTTGEGPIIARTLIEGQLERGESTREMAAVVLDEVKTFGEALSEDELPRKYDKALKHYFGELEKQVRAIEAAAANSTADPSSSPDD